jgi:tetratricopeptide (TPR) repeat protein
VDLGDGSGWQLFGSDTVSHPAEPHSPGDPAQAAAARLPAMPRKFRLDDATRARLLQNGIAIAATDYRPTPLEGEDRTIFLTQLIRIRHHFGENRDRRTARTTRRQLENHPDNLAALLDRGILMVMVGSEKQAAPIFEKLFELYPDRPGVLHWAAHLALLREELGQAEALLEAARSLGFQDGDLLYDLACIHALKGETDPSLRYLAQAIEAGYRNWQWIERDPDLESIRSDPEYSRLMQGIGR